MKRFFTLTAVISLLSWLQQVTAHMQMSEPYPIRSPLNPALTWRDKIDYSYTSPLDYNGANYPCKGFQNDRPILLTATYEAGGEYTMKYAGTATHGGGSCQISLSYDNGKTFRVIKSIIGGCPLPLEYHFTIPTYAPNGTALLAWTWFNLIGNREIYMDCAEVQIQGSKAKPAHHRTARKTRRQNGFTSFDQLPYIWKANLPNINNCTTTEGVNPVFPDPGPDVEYGAGMSASSPKSPAYCDSPTPYGPTYKDLNPEANGHIPSPASSGGVLPPITSTIPAMPPGMMTTTAPGPAAPTPPAAGTSSSPAASPLPSSLTSPSSHLPCVPGTFLCTSRTTFSQCFSAYAYLPTGSVAPGMRCMPYTTDGHRDDKIVVDAPLGACTPSVDGQAVKCLRDGTGYAVCDEGAWFDMGAVTAGLKCENGLGIVAAPPPEARV